MGVLIALRRLGWLDPHSAAKRLAEITRQKRLTRKTGTKQRTLVAFPLVGWRLMMAHGMAWVGESCSIVGVGHHSFMPTACQGPDTLKASPTGSVAAKSRWHLLAGGWFLACMVRSSKRSALPVVRDALPDPQGPRW